MKTLLKSKLARKLNVESLLFSPFFFVKGNTVTPFINEMRRVYKLQEMEISALGLALAFAIVFLCLAFNVTSWYLMLIFLLYFISQPLWVLVEFCIKRDINEVSLVKQATIIGKDWKLPSHEKASYEIFSWFDFI